jgi:hypothetical protein
MGWRIREMDRWLEKLIHHHRHRRQFPPPPPLLLLPRLRGDAWKQLHPRICGHLLCFYGDTLVIIESRVSCNIPMANVYFVNAGSRGRNIWARRTRHTGTFKSWERCQ